MDLIIIWLLTLITAPVVEFTDGVPRIVLGVLFLLVSPGYSLMAALFPRRDRMDGMERIALSLILSFALVALNGLILNYTPWKIRLTPILIFNCCLILCFLVIAAIRRSELAYEERFQLRINIKLPHWQPPGKLNKFLSLGLVLAVIATITTMGYVIAEPRNEEDFTDFYLLGPEGMMENYPQEVVLGEEASVILGIKNHENKDIDYNIVITIDGEELYRTNEPVHLVDEEGWSSTISLLPTKTGNDQEIEFLLYKAGDSEPYLPLHLWLDVKVGG